MKHSFIVLVTASLFLFSCNNGDKIPDVSNIKINLTTDRFEKNLFDTTTTSLVSYLKQLQNGNTEFTSIYLRKILGADPQWPADTTAAYVNSFIKAFRTVYNDTEKKISNFSVYENEIRHALQLVKYYFPSYKVPEKIITYIGPPDGVGAAISNDGLLVGLHNYLGKDYPLYKTGMVNQFYPEYISQRFEPEYISINCLKIIVTDIYPEKNTDQPLINQMVEKGKQLYLLSKFLPTTDEYKLIGYKQNQLKDCYDHEAVIWDLFIKNSFLQTTDKNIIKNYVDEGPKTEELGEGSPGNIGSFTGWQIVKKYMQKNAATTLQQLTDLDDETIFQAAKYKP
jgi:hypothetical protein